MVQTTEDNYHDVLIVGAGPAGCMAALILARMGITPLVIDATDHAGHQYGRSDAFQSRCMEVMQSFGAPIEQLEHMGKKLYGRTFWEISSDSKRRTGFARFYPEFLDYDKDYSLAVRQGLIEQVMIHDTENHYEGFEVQWNWGFVSMELPKEKDGNSTILIKHTKTGEEKTVTAKYVIGCDGARSTVRRWASQFGAKLEGEPLPVTWCVLDAVGLKSDHPDLERLCILRSPKGIVLVIPREPINGKPAARFDIQLETSRYEATQEDATKMIKEIFHPFKLEWDEVNWWSSYDVGQRIINKYTIDEKVFFVGDACHTHSPRAGLGLNTALLESHNLCWKIAMVLKGIAKPNILSTYAFERHAVAKQLVTMDRRLVELYAGLEKQTMSDFSSDEATEWLTKLRLFQASNYAYQAGASIVYEPSALTVTPTGKTDLMAIGHPGVAIGSRTRPAVVTRLSDSVPVPILSQFDGRFTIYILVGDLTEPGALDRLKDLDAYIRESAGSIFHKFGFDVNVEEKQVHKRMPSLQIPTTHGGNLLVDGYTFGNASGYSANGNGNAHAKSEAFPAGRILYHYDYDDIPQITGDYLSRPHSLFRVSVVTTSSTSSTFVLNDLLPLLYPTADDQEDKKHSRIFHPAHFYCDDIPIISPYRETAPEAGVVFENPMHQKWDVDRKVGSIIVARPDAHVAMKTNGFGRESWESVEQFFSGFLV
ncbi:hypothetical protein JAAARDRAFT_185320 [Jaapia argillacea MUCL 33604]|uniref:FAD-binding domain-containing protein n=1 Tax=Jaapia argillacea MUCL 33604 TaxID=933084 RepID=A0A067P8N6_9AGAM|nr:hypothetical protein JAAARDRAFT_185320 [Jaapia argillacea MUCL 33604]